MVTITHARTHAHTYTHTTHCLFKNSGMIQARMDHFDDTDQLVVKSAAVLGVSFLRDLLEHVLPQNITSEHCGMSLKRLAESNILICGFSDPDSASLQSPLCLCPNDEGETRPKSMEQCQFVRFIASTFQQTAYQIFLEKTRKSLHIQAAQFLESVSHECTACGGDKFLHSVWLKYNEIEKASLAGESLSHYIYNCMFVCVCVYIYIYVCVCVYICVCVCVCVCK